MTNMSLTQPKNTLRQAGNLANICAVFALILDVFNPIRAIAVESIENYANASQKEAAVLEEFISESPEGKLLSVEPDPDRVVPGVITAYTSTPDQTDDSPFIAASGKHVYDGMIAVNGLPFGTRIKIPELYGDKIFTVDDRMNKRYSCRATRCRLDIWLDTTKKEAKKFGVKKFTVEVYYQAKELAAK